MPVCVQTPATSRRVGEALLVEFKKVQVASVAAVAREGCEIYWLPHSKCAQHVTNLKMVEEGDSVRRRDQDYEKAVVRELKSGVEGLVKGGNSRRSCVIAGQLDSGVDGQLESGVVKPVRGSAATQLKGSADGGVPEAQTPEGAQSQAHEVGDTDSHEIPRVVA